MIGWLALLGFVSGSGFVFLGLVVDRVGGAIMAFIGGSLAVMCLMIGFVVAVWGPKKRKGV